ncbi:MAG: hypothetical protein RIR18_1359 [Pseudomonadota bacterium]|jgi:uncharacterized protein (TIGR00251 family)
MPALPIWLQDYGTFCCLTLHIQPGAKKTQIAGEHGEALKIRLAAPPVDGKANAALLTFLAKTLGLAKSGVRLKSGDTSRHKRVEIDASTQSVLTVLATLL